jgi:phospho-N-acetylmuramoyl-pentapeptide-transferase
MQTTISDAVKIFTPAVMSFIIGMAITPLITHYMYEWKLWKKSSVPKTTDGKIATITQEIHRDESRRVPRMGGIIIIASTFLTVGIIALCSYFFPGTAFQKFNFLSRSQTWLPAFTLFLGGFFGFLDDWHVVHDTGSSKNGGGMSIFHRLIFVVLLALLGATWFYLKLGVSSIHIPFAGEFNMGIIYIPFFVFTMLAMYSGGIIDGIDGLAGGVFVIMYVAYGAIAYSHHLVDIATFSMTIAGSLLVFLWFNIPPARFFLSETGTMALTTTLAMIAFLTGEIVVLVIVAFPLLITAMSSIIQLLSKRFRNGKKVFLVAPLHNHFIKMGWPPYKVTMRYWVFSALCAVLGIVVSLVS